MTLEGFVLFEALYDGTIRVERAVPPFENQAFARGVMEDIRLIFFKPLARELTTGLLADGTGICRYGFDDGSFIDISPLQDNQWELRRFGPDRRLKRVVKHINNGNPTGQTRVGIADKIELTALGTPDYKLFLDLVEAIPLKNE
jgi:hypothetical protein